MQKIFYQQLLSIAPCYRLNTATGQYYEHLAMVKDILGTL